MNKEPLLIFTSDDAPLCNQKVKKLKHLKDVSTTSTEVLPNLDQLYKSSLQEAKQKIYKTIIKDLKTSNPSQWYSKLKNISTYDRGKYETLNCSQIEHLSDRDQAEKFAEHFCAVREQFYVLKTCDISIPYVDEIIIPQFGPNYVEEKLAAINPKKSVPRGDIPPKLL